LKQQARLKGPVVTPSLDQLRPGQRGRIEALDGNDSLVQRLMEMGLLEGEEIEVVRFAPLGEPVEVRLGDYCLSLRRREAARIRVKPLDGVSGE
jgi:Fe2+ transport system protein FeoA